MAAKNTKLTLRLSESEKTLLNEIAEARDISTSQLVRELIRIGLKEVK